MKWSRKCMSIFYVESHRGRYWCFSGTPKIRGFKLIYVNWLEKLLKVLNLILHILIYKSNIYVNLFDSPSHSFFKKFKFFFHNFYLKNWNQREKFKSRKFYSFFHQFYSFLVKIFFLNLIYLILPKITYFNAK